MARIFITGSSDGLGMLAAKQLIQLGHSVVVHARNMERSKFTMKNIPGAEKCLAGNLADMDETKILASAVNDSGSFDAVIHNAGVYESTAREIFAVNTIAPYILTCLINRPGRLIYLSSGMHLQGTITKLESAFKKRETNYSDSKLHDVILCMAVARLWPDVNSNAVNPGWVPTKMGGSNAPDDIQKGAETQVWLAVSNDAAANVSGRYFHHMKERAFSKVATDHAIQEKFLSLCEQLTGVTLHAKN
jgi:NAD(P)-dependent dehydrogenase (short-subunit alcohol dehydrogenase family)